ncbi:MAG TPA: hypothetical protein VGM24_12295 [Puia sp.]|jgi:hypothetical protein
MKTILTCLECGKRLTEGVEEFSHNVYGYPLCLRHQAYITDSGASPQAVDVYFALKAKKIPVILEYWDGYKQVDIALPGRLHIEVNTPSSYETVQAFVDLKRSVYSLKENISTIIIPDYLLDDPAMFQLTVEELAKACRSVMNAVPFPNLTISMN